MKTNLHDTDISPEKEGPKVFDILKELESLIHDLSIRKE
jgi:hypothetical protein